MNVFHKCIICNNWLCPVWYIHINKENNIIISSLLYTSIFFLPWGTSGEEPWNGHKSWVNMFYAPGPAIPSPNGLPAPRACVPPPAKAPLLFQMIVHHRDAPHLSFINIRGAKRTQTRADEDQGELVDLESLCVRWKKKVPIFLPESPRVDMHENVAWCNYCWTLRGWERERERARSTRYHILFLQGLLPTFCLHTNSQLMEVELEFRALFLHDAPPQEYRLGYAFVINSLNGQRSLLDPRRKKKHAKQGAGEKSEKWKNVCVEKRLIPTTRAKQRELKGMRNVRFE